MSKLTQLQELIKTHNEGNGISSKEIAQELQIPHVTTVYGMINMLKTKKGMDIIQENGLYKINKNGKNHEQELTRESPRKTKKLRQMPKAPSAKVPPKDTNLLNKMSDEDRNMYMEFKRKAIYYSKAAEGLVESYKQTAA